MTSEPEPEAQTETEAQTSGAVTVSFAVCQAFPIPGQRQARLHPRRH